MKYPVKHKMYSMFRDNEMQQIYWISIYFLLSQ